MHSGMYRPRLRCTNATRALTLRFRLTVALTSPYEKDLGRDVATKQGDLCDAFRQVWGEMTAQSDAFMRTVAFGRISETVLRHSDVDFSFGFRDFKLLDWLRVKHLKYGTVLPGKWMKIFEQQRIMLIFIYVCTLNLYFLYFRPQSNVHQRLPSFNIEDLTQIWICSSSKLDKNVSVDVVRGAAA